MPALAQTEAILEMTLTGVPLPITLRPAAPLSDEQIMAFSRRNKPYQVERNAKGELEIMSPAGGDGSIWEAVVIGELRSWAKENGGVSFSSNGGFNLPDGAMRSPDAAWISDARWYALSKAERRGYPPICPEFLTEVMSASDSRKTLEAKMQSWIDNGAQLAWMVDPYAATLSIYRPGMDVEVLERPDSVEAGPPVAGFRLSTLLLWDE